MPGYKLSARMAAVAGLVPTGVTACDIGCDHGFIAIYLVEKQICPRVIAMDIHKGPLLRAREHIEKVSLSTYIETRLSDGLNKFEAGEAACMIAAGMGGRLTVKILSDYPEKRKSLRYLVLQPQSELSLVRKFLREKGFAIRKEDMVFEEGKFYPMMLAENMSSGEGGEAAGNQSRLMESLADEFGPCLLRDGHPVLLQYLDWWEKQQNKIREQVFMYPARRAQVEEELFRIREARRWMEKRGDTDEVL